MISNLYIFPSLYKNVDSNIFISDYDLFLVDNTLLITFLFFFLKYLNNKESFKLIVIVPYFIPVIFYVGIELFEVFIYESYIIEIIEHLLYFAFVTYLLFSLFFIYKRIHLKSIKISFYIVIFSLLFV